MEDAANECHVSHASAWEMAIKLNLGKLQLDVEYTVIFPGVLNANGFFMLHPRSITTTRSFHFRPITAIHSTVF